MAGYPLVLEGTRLTALVVGGGRVAHRKVVALLDAGARVRVVALRLCPALRDLGQTSPRLRIEERAYRPEDIADATLVVAATDDRRVNGAVAVDAERERRLVNVADAPREGNCITAATHRSGPLIVAVAAGIPRASVRIRDAIAKRFDERYAAALGALAATRARLLAAGERAAWQAVEQQMTGPDFCAQVEDGMLSQRLHDLGRDLPRETGQPSCR
jgi:siroheme synthase-like protein